MSLHEKIYNIMCESKALEKDMSVGGQYKAISEAAVLNEIKPLFKKYKIIFIPIEATAKQEGKITQIEAKYKIIDIESGEFEILATVGNGADTQDKGSGKAWTYAYKALIQKTFCLFSGEDTENTHSDDIDSEQKVTTAQLAEALGDNVEAIIEHYNKKTGKNITELKFMAQEYKQAYYKKAKEKQNG